MKIQPTRRGFITALAPAIAGPLAISWHSRTFASATSSNLSPTEAAKHFEIGFVGENLLQLTIVDSDFDVPSPVKVPPGALVAWSPNPDSRFGGAGRLGGISGNFSGNKHTSSSQTFRPWPHKIAGSDQEAFSPLLGISQQHTRADTPAFWTIQVDGVPVKVITVYRNTVPVGAARTSTKALMHRKRHRVTLQLGSAVPLGANVAISAPTLIEASVIRQSAQRSEAVHICQIGYAQSGPKKGYVGLWLGVDQNGVSGNTDPSISEATLWRLVDINDDSTAANGTLKLAKAGNDPHFDELNFNGCDIYEANFTSTTASGNFRLEIDGIGSSFDFEISANPYFEAFRLAARWYFHQRSGCPIKEPFGEGRTRPRNGHPDDGLTVWQTNAQLGRTSEGFSRGPYAPKYMGSQPIGVTNANAWGGWHDAGDWDRRVQHMDAVYQMANMVEMFDTIRSLDMNIPESGKTFADAAVKARKNAADTGDGLTVLPDIIHEALWGISLWRRTQGATGGIIGGVEYSSDGIEGSVSWNPVQRTYAYAEEEWAAYQFVSAAAKLGHVIKNNCGDQILGTALINEAEAAWNWAERELASGSALDHDLSVSNIARVRVRAAAVLYRANGNLSAKTAFDGHNPFKSTSKDAAPVTYKADIPFEAFDYVKAAAEGRDANPEIVSVITEWAGRRLVRDKRIGADYGLHNTARYPWGAGWNRFGPGSNWRARFAGLEYLVNGGDPNPIRNIAIEGMWFGLGCNPSNVSFVQGLGSRVFADMLTLDLIGRSPVPGQICFGVAGGGMRKFEKRKTAGTIYPEDQGSWPRYAQIFESSRVVICAEHDIKANAMEWLFACAVVDEVLSIEETIDQK